MPEQAPEPRPAETDGQQQAGELERQAPGGRTLTNQLVELGLLGVLTLALATAIYLVRRSSAASSAVAPTPRA